MSEHTPGPWSVDDVPNYDGVTHVSGPWVDREDGGQERETAAVVSGFSKPMKPADLALIAAAPDLLAIVADWVSVWDGEHPMLYDAALRAITKAEGVNDE